MKFKVLLATSVAGISVAVAAPAAAQSAASVDFEDEGVIVVSGTRTSDVGGIEVPDSAKAKQVVSEELIRAQRPGQTVNDIVNLVPGVSFQNNDPWGSSGGSFTIRGFTSDRISQTVDGVPLNDSGNYALYTNQQQDPETLQSINVNLGSTDVDSPTASASGGTINIRTRRPSDDFGVTMALTAGDVFAEGNGESERDRLYMRGFVMLDTGDLTGMGTKGFVSGSFLQYNNPFNNYGTNQKQQLNARIWQDIGVDGDYVAVAGHYNENRNNFFGSFRLPDFPTTREDRFYNLTDSDGNSVYPCQTTEPTAGEEDKTNACGTQFDRRYNPSNTGNIRGASRFTLAEGLVLSVEPSFQYVKANGGGTSKGREGSATVGGDTFFGYIGGSPYAGVDLNGDGDLLDQVTVLTPSQTRTKRYAVISNIAYELNQDHSVRLAYTWERANHRQTGQVGFLQPNGEPFDVFPVNNGIVDVNGNVLQKRDRQSYAILNQISGQYIGQFGNLRVDAGLRAPFFKRELQQNCFTTSANGFVDCVYGEDVARYAEASPYVVTTDPVTGEVTVSGAAAPQARTLKYDKILPSLGLVYDFGDNASIFANVSQGLQVPGTDNLYNSFYFPQSIEALQPRPEETKNADIGVRVRSGDIMAQVSLWGTQYDNRLASAYDPELERTVYRNLGRVNKYGVDGSVSWQPRDNFVLYVFGSLLQSEIRDDIQGGVCTAPTSSRISNTIYGCDATNVGEAFFLDTAGKRESGAPTHSFGGRVQWNPGAFQFGLQAKRTGKRYINDTNRPLYSSANSSVSGGVVTAPEVLYGATVDGYTLVDFDARLKLGETAWGGDAAIQLNVSNLLDTLYVGGFGGNLDPVSSPNVQIGAPRAASISLVIGY